MADTPAKIAIVLLAALLLHRPPAAAGQEVEDEKDFSYKLGSENGPEKWGHIHKEWAACGAGRLQSPIDLCDERVSLVDGLGPLRRTYRPACAVMKNRGHDIMLKWEENAGGVWINGSEYSLKQLHWHSLSEHTVNGRRYLMEVHMVHESADKKLAVVGILYKEGRPDSFLTEMESYIRKLGDTKGELRVGAVNPMHVQWGSRKYYRYMGSLTTPPCTEGVIWTIIKKELCHQEILLRASSAEVSATRSGKVSTARTSLQRAHSQREHSSRRLTLSRCTSRLQTKAKLRAQA